MEKALKTAQFAITTPAFTGGAMARGWLVATMVSAKSISPMVKTTMTTTTMTKHMKKVRGG